jgi:hypothetical protein
MFVGALVLLALGAIGTIGFMLYAAQPWRSDQPFGLGHIAFMSWAIMPYVAGAVLARVFRDQRRSLIIILIGLAISVGSALFIYYYSLFVHIDAQGALIFVFFPVYQLAFTLILAAGAAICRIRPA